MSGDYTDPNLIEVWPQVLEAAYARMKGGYEVLNCGGGSADAWESFVGPFMSSFRPKSTFADANELADFLALQAFLLNQLVISTAPNPLDPSEDYEFPLVAVPAVGDVGGRVYAPHVYRYSNSVLVGGVIEYIILDNPHGNTVMLTKDQLYTATRGVHILYY